MMPFVCFYVVERAAYNATPPLNILKCCNLYNLHQEVILEYRAEG